MVNKAVKFIGIAALVIIIDQIIKNFANKLEQPINLIGNVVKITFLKNYGASFGIFKNQTWLFILFSIIVIAAIIYYYKKIPNEYFTWIALIFGGTIGNLIDRLRFAYVIDFMDFTYWPVFNIADVALVLGAGVIIYKILRKKEHKKKIVDKSKKSKKKISKKKK